MMKMVLAKEVMTCDPTPRRSVPTFRLLNNQDHDLFEHFLKSHMATSMFMRSNARRSGLKFKPNQDYSASYWGAFDQDQLKGVLSVNWNGNLMIQVPDEARLKKFFYFVQSHTPSNTFIKGILGPDLQAQQILTYLNPLPENLMLSRLEICYHLTLKNMIYPPRLNDGTWRCRLANRQDLDVLIPWQIAYDVEALQIDSRQTDTSDIVQKELTKRIARAEIFVLEDRGQCVARADYNATLPDIHQIGGVWTPPEFRNRGYARAVVAGACQVAHHHGVEFATLFTNNPAAMRAYESLGFCQVDHYHITLFKNPVCLVS